MVRRIYVEKKPGLRQEAQSLLRELRSVVGVSALEDLRLLNRYDVEGLEEAAFRRAVGTVFSEPQVDDAAAALPAGDCVALPGQFDQRADSAAQCIQLMTQGERPTVRTAKVYLLFGPLTAADVEAVKRYVINPVECREASLDLPERLTAEAAAPADVETVSGFTALDRVGLDALLARLGLAMDLEDLSFLQTYDTERRDPTLTEIRVVDTYWSDHCRHTTFSTHLDRVEIHDPAVRAAYDRYLAAREEVYGKEKATQRPQTLMDIATIGAKALKKRGLLPELDESEEINACSIRVSAQVNSRTAGSRTGCYCSRTRPTTTPRRSSPSAAPPPASAGVSGTPCPAGPMCTRPCGSPAAATPGRRWRRPCPASSPSGRSPRPLPRATPPTATRSVWQRGWSARSTTPAISPST